MGTSITDLLREHKGKAHIRGDRDCNLLFCALNEPEHYHKLRHEYTGIADGVKAAHRILGVKSVRHFLRKNNYIPIDPNFQILGDTVVFNKGHNVFISLGNKWFGVNKDDLFGLVDMHDYVVESYQVYRKG